MNETTQPKPEEPEIGHRTAAAHKSTSERLMRQAIEELTLLLLHLTAWDEQITSDLSVRTNWKNHHFNLLDALDEAGYLSQTRKTVTLTPTGIERAELLAAKYLGNVAGEETD